MDEPTNDLDTETLELLEERLVEYQGTLLIVSHDREFLNHVVTSTLSFEDGTVKEYDGGYDDWKRQRDENLRREPRLSRRRKPKPKRNRRMVPERLLRRKVATLESRSNGS